MRLSISPSEQLQKSGDLSYQKDFTKFEAFVLIEKSTYHCQKSFIVITLLPILERRKMWKLWQMWFLLRYW